MWASLIRTLRHTMGGSGAFARLLGCDPVQSTEHFDGSVGQTLPGFRVVDAEPGYHLTLEGRHRFSRYRLTFELDTSRVRARTDAAFPGALGGHKLITRRMLRQIAA